MPGRLLGVVAVAVIAGFAAAVFASPERGSQPMPMEGNAEPVVKTLAAIEVIDVAPIDLRETLSLWGEAAPVRRAVVSAEVTGLAGTVTHLPGEAVTAGEILLSIAPDDYRLTLQAEQANLASLQAQLHLAQSTLARTTQLAGRGAASDAALEQAQSAVDVLLANIEGSEGAVRLAEINLDRATVKAPISGIVASRSVEPGQLVQAGTALFEIIDLSTVMVEAMVPLADAAMLGEGQTAQFWPAGEPVRRFEARLVRISPRAVTGTRSAIVYLQIENSADMLRGGMFLSGSIELRRAEDRLALPRGAIHVDGETASVLAIRGGRAIRVPVATGAEWHAGSLVEITDGLHVGDRVVAMPLTGLEPGDRVAVSDDRS